MSHGSHHHDEQHFNASAVVRDVVLGMSDGLTVPFALAAGLTSAVSDSGIVITAGLAEIAAGAVAMGLGGYLAARTEMEHFQSERAREERETIEIPEEEAEEVARIFRGYGLADKDVTTVVDAIRSDRKRWVDFMMKFELGIEAPNPKRARNSAVTIGLAYVLGGLIPLSPYFAIHDISRALMVSAAVTLVALGVFGYVRGKFTVTRPLRSAWQTVLVGALAAATAYSLAHFIA